jgi:hypothetical protein
MSLLPDRGPPGPLIFMPLSPLGERLGEGVMQEAAFGTPSPNLSPKGERYMREEEENESFANRKPIPPSCQP